MKDTRLTGLGEPEPHAILKDGERQQLEELDAALRELEGENYGIFSGRTMGMVKEPARDEAARRLQQMCGALQAQRQGMRQAHERTAILYNCVGRLHVRLGQYAEALDCFWQAKELREHLHAGDHPDLAASYHFVAGGNYLLGRHQQALDWLEEDLAMTERMLGAEHPEVGITRQYLNMVRELCD